MRQLPLLAPAARRALLAPGRRRTAYAVLFVLLVTVAAVALTAQGWRSRITAFDLLPYVRAVHELLENGTLPVHGDAGSYGSFKPPGTAWLMAPSALLFDDTRLSEYAGTALLHLATLAGLFLLARKYFGARCAALAVVLYGLSATGLFLAGSLWPNGRPDFFVWTVYLASEWVTRRDARFLGASLAVLGLGMYVDLALTPALLILPALWLLYRPPLRATPVAAAVALLLVVWLPYLRFEADRGFADLRSQLLFQSIRPAVYKDSWCDPSLTLVRYGETPTEAADTGRALLVADTPAADPVRRRVDEFRGKLTANFDVRVPHVDVVLAAVVLVSLLLFSLPGSSRRGADDPVRRRLRLDGLTLAALPAVAVAVLVGTLLVPWLADEGGFWSSAASILHRLAKLVALAGIVVVGARVAGAVAAKLLAHAGVRLQTPEWLEQRRLVIVALGIPWFVLLAVAEPGKPERFMWLWPLQALFLAAFATVLLPRLRAPRLLMGAVVAGLVVLVVGNSVVSSRLGSWRDDGWSGRDALEVQIVDHVARDLGVRETSRAAIGYQVFIYEFMVVYNTINPEYKVGADLDLLFEFRHGVVNTNRCAEGVSPGDRYRIVQTRPRPESWRPRQYFDVALGPEFRVVEQIGDYRVYRRSS